MHSLKWITAGLLGSLTVLGCASKLINDVGDVVTGGVPATFAATGEAGGIEADNGGAGAPPVVLDGAGGDPLLVLDAGEELDSWDSQAGDGAPDAGPCTLPGTPAVSRFPAGYVMSYEVVGPCDGYRTCVECLAGPTGLSACQWCGNATGTGSCVAETEACPDGFTTANVWNGYCPEFCDQMDGTSCSACTKQVRPFDESCAWCPETQDCFNERAAQVGWQETGYCGGTKGSANGLSCEEVPPLCSP